MPDARARLQSQLPVSTQARTSVHFRALSPAWLAQRMRGDAMANHELRTEIEIAAPAARVWAILTDFAAYPTWNPFIVSLEGTLAANAVLVARMRPPGSARAMTFKPRVCAHEPGKRFAWLGSLPIPGLFAGEHSFELTALAPDRVRLAHGETFRGLLIPLLRKTLDGPTRAGFIAMNEAVKQRAEASA
jgi:hypothetical protein